jgi:hypothetical protein
MLPLNHNDVNGLTIVIHFLNFQSKRSPALSICLEFNHISIFLFTAAQVAHLRNVHLNRLRHVEEVSRAPGVRTLFEFVQQNRRLFRGPVYGPLAVEVDLRQPEMAPIVEKQCGLSMLLNYCVTCK